MGSKSSYGELRIPDLMFPSTQMIVRTVALSLLSFVVFAQRTIAQPTHQLSELRTDTAEDLRGKWLQQREGIQTGRIEGSYWLCGKQPVSRDKIATFLNGLLLVLERQPTKEVAADHISKSFPGEAVGMQWRNLAFTVDGRKTREKFERGTEKNKDYITQETVWDGSNEAMYWSDSRQVSVFSANSPWSRMGLGSFRNVPSDNVSSLPIKSTDDNVVELGNETTSYFVDLKSGHLIRQTHDDAGAHSEDYQIAFQQYDSVSLPTAVVSVTYYKESLYRLSIMVVRTAEFNISLSDDFRLAAPGGTVIADLRPDGNDDAYLTKHAVTDSVAWLNRQRLSASKVTLEPSAGSRKNFLAINAGVVLLLAGLMVIKWRKKSTQH
jgi:hypothetical protein